LPSISNPVDLNFRQGAIEVIYHLIHVMGDNILPYVIFLIVPVLGRMSDSDNDVRLIATTSFATLVKLVPLEAGIPDPPGLSQELLKGRDRERTFIAQLLDPHKVEPFTIPVAIKAELRSYQQEGVNWLHFLNKYHLHGILCDDMGLGKTLQTLCIVASDHHMRAEEFAKTGAPDVRRLPSLIVCPPTLSGHWQQEINTYAPFLTCTAYVGPPADRLRLRDQLTKTDIVITSYDICRNDSEVLTPLNWNYLVLDEGHLIKNPRAKVTIAVKQLLSNHRLILSGTPIQNNVLELWSLFDFLMPGFLGAEKVFLDRFAKPIAASRFSKSSSKEQEAGALAIEALHKQVLPFLLRRLKEEVLDDLPPKILQNYYCDLSDLQKKLFEDFTKREGKTIAEKAAAGDKEGKTHIFQALQYMRKLCNSPALVMKEGHKQYEDTQRFLAKEGTSLRDPVHAPKLTALRDLLVDCGIGVENSAEEVTTETSYVSPHRALIFCQMKEMLDMVQNDVLKKMLPSVQYLRMDGSVDASRRQDIVNKFNSDPSYDVLLLTTSVGGLGLNLTGADTVIFVEHDWNPQKDLQAMDRAHRIGQKKVVNVYRLITRGTLEEKIMSYVSWTSLLSPYRQANIRKQAPKIQNRCRFHCGESTKRWVRNNGDRSDP
jgi:TATA-binding protein-associated factor